MRKVMIFTVAIMVFIVSACSKPKEFDGSKNITIYTRDTTSGTRAGFMEGIGFADAATNDSILATGFVTKDNTGIMTSVGTDLYAIGYVSLSSVDNTVKGVPFEGVKPTVENVVNDTYGLKRPFMWMIRDDSDYETPEIEALVKAFIAFLGTVDAADIINNNGAIAIPTSVTWDDIKAEHPITAANNSAITIRFGGSDSIQKVAEALTSTFKAKAGNFVAEHDHTGSGDAYKRTQTQPLTDPVSKHVGFASRYFKDSEKVGVEENLLGQLAWDAIVVVVNKANPIQNFTKQQIKQIYDGTVTTWDGFSE